MITYNIRTKNACLCKVKSGGECKFRLHELSLLKNTELYTVSFCPVLSVCVYVYVLTPLSHFVIFSGMFGYVRKTSSPGWLAQLVRALP